MSKKLQIIDYLSKNKEMMKANFHIEKIGLFGSQARDDADSMSDIDILVSFDESAFDIFGAKFEIAELLKKEFHCNVDVASEKYLKPRVKEQIMKEVLYV